MRLILIRHGQTPANVLGRLDTDHPGPGLTELGSEQARALPDALAGEPISAVYVSVLVRTQLTAAPLAEALGLETEVLPGIHEIEAGALEKRSDRESVVAYLETVWAWGQGEMDRAMPGGGTDGTAFFARFDADIAELAQRHPADATVAVVSHGAAIRVWAAGPDSNLPPRFTAERDLGNTGIVILEGEPGAWTVVSWQGEPVGGADLDDEAARDVTGEPASEAVDEAD